MENRNYIVAVDLGSSSVVVAAGSRSDDGKLSVREVVVQPTRGVARGEVKNVELAAQSLKDAVDEMERRLGVAVSEVYTGISGSHIRCAKHPYYVIVANRDGEISEDDVRRLNESMSHVQAPEGYALMHIIPQHYIVNEDEEVPDPVGMFGKTLGSTFNLIIGENAILSRLDKALQKVGLRSAKMFINPLSMAEAVAFPDEKELGVAVVDMGAGTTDVCIYQDGIVRNISVIPIGADSINKDIRSYGIMERYVEELKLEHGCAVPAMVDEDKLVRVPGRTPSDHKDISFRNLSSIIEARLLDMVDYVVDEIKIAGFEGKLGAGIILTGGGARLREIKTLIEKRTGMDVRIAVPDILVDDESKEKVADQGLAAAVGILWQGLGTGGGATVKPRAQERTHEEVRDEGIFNPVRGGAGERGVYAGDGARDEERGSGRRRKSRRRSDVIDDDYGDSNGESLGVDHDYSEQDADEGRGKRRGLFGWLKKTFDDSLDINAIDDDTTI